jgi:TusE/DsrC/DsvC family sulfur relay protein
MPAKVPCWRPLRLASTLDKAARSLVGIDFTFVNERHPMNIPERDGDGYLTDMNAWTEDVGRAMAEADGYELDEAKWDQIMKARAYFEEFSSVPPIRKFAKFLNEDQNAVFKLWMTGPMKPITKYGGLPKPTGCV